MINTRVLVIEKESAMLGFLVEKLRSRGYEVFSARNRMEGLRVLKAERPDIVLSAIWGGRVKGVEFLSRIKGIDPEAKVIVMTEDGNQETAVEALRRGAINYLKKPVTFWELYEIIEKAVSIQSQVINKEFVFEERKRIIMGNEIDKIWGVVNQLLICADNICDKGRVQELGLGLYEIIMNAIEHGNLEISFDEKCRAVETNTYGRLLQERLSNPSFSRRRVTIDYHMIPGELHYVVRDEGKGFNWRDWLYLDPSSNLLTPCGRGILLARSYLDRVEFNHGGTEVHVVKWGKRDEKEDQKKKTRKKRQH